MRHNIGQTSHQRIMRGTIRVLLAVSLTSCAMVAQAQDKKLTHPPHDAVAEAQEPRTVLSERPEQRQNAHDRSDVFKPPKARPSSPAFLNQLKDGKASGFDFYRDPLGAEKPLQEPDEMMKTDMANKAKVMETQRKLLERRYHLEPKLDPEAKMSRGKSLVVGPTARLPKGMTWERLAEVGSEEIKQHDLFPYPSLPHPLQSPGGMVFPQMQIDMFPRLERFDIDFDLPAAFLPEFPPAMFLSNRPELGDVSRGEVVSINNYYRLF
jgi:hypothetical protein